MDKHAGGKKQMPKQKRKIEHVEEEEEEEEEVKGPESYIIREADEGEDEEEEDDGEMSDFIDDGPEEEDTRRAKAKAKKFRDEDVKAKSKPKLRRVVSDDEDAPPPPATEKKSKKATHHVQEAEEAEEGEEDEEEGEESGGGVTDMEGAEEGEGEDGEGEGEEEAAEASEEVAEGMQRPRGKVRSKPRASNKGGSARSTYTEDKLFTYPPIPDAPAVYYEDEDVVRITTAITHRPPTNALVALMGDVSAYMTGTAQEPPFSSAALYRYQQLARVDIASVPQSKLVQFQPVIPTFSDGSVMCIDVWFAQHPPKDPAELMAAIGELIRFLHPTVASRINDELLYLAHALLIALPVAWNITFLPYVFTHIKDVYEDIKADLDDKTTAFLGGIVLYYHNMFKYCNARPGDGKDAKTDNVAACQEMCWLALPLVPHSTVTKHSLAILVSKLKKPTFDAAQAQFVIDAIGTGRTTEHVSAALKQLARMPTKTDKTNAPNGTRLKDVRSVPLSTAIRALVRLCNRFKSPATLKVIVTNLLKLLADYNIGEVQELVPFAEWAERDTTNALSKDHPKKLKAVSRKL